MRDRHWWPRKCDEGGWKRVSGRMIARKGYRDRLKRELEDNEERRINIRGMRRQASLVLTFLFSLAASPRLVFCLRRFVR